MKGLDLIFAARPLLHLPVWSIYLVSLRYHNQLSGESFGWMDLLTMGCLSLLSAGAYYLNQIHDRAGDAINGKLGFIELGYLSERTMMGAFLAVSAIPLVVAAVTSWVLLVVFAQLLLMGYMYSVAPFRLKDRAFWGLFANAWAFGFLIPFTVMPDLDEHNAGLLGWDNPFFFFLAVGSIYLLTTIPDREGDKATGKRTLAVAWPLAVVKIVALVLMALAAGVAWRSGFPALMVVAAISIIPIGIALAVSSVSAERFAAKLPILLLTLLAGWHFPGYLVFVLVLLVGTRLYYKIRFGEVYPKLT